MRKVIYSLGYSTLPGAIHVNRIEKMPTKHLRISAVLSESGCPKGEAPFSKT